MKMNVEITDEQYKALRDEIKEELREEMEEKVVKDELCASCNLGIEELCEKFGLRRKYEGIQIKKVKDLSDEELRILFLHIRDIVLKNI